MKEDQLIDDEIKTMFKVSKRLQIAFSDVKILSHRFLLKYQKIKERKVVARRQRIERERVEEIERRKRQKNDILRERKRRERQGKLREQEEQKNKNRNSDHSQERKQPKRSIISVLRKNKPENDKSEQHKKVQIIDPEPKNEPHPKAKKKKDQENGPQKDQASKVFTKPIEPQSPYFRFLREKRSEIKASSPNMSMEQVSRIMRNIWEKLTDMQKRPYVLSYEKAKSEYEREMYLYYSKGNKEKEAKGKKGEKGEKGEKEQKANGEYDFIDQFGDI